MNWLRRPAFITTIVVAVWAATAPVAAAGDVYYLPATGHCYQIMDPADGTGWHFADDITWTGARNSSLSSFYMGVRGHLVTITSQEENDFVQSLLEPGRDYWIGAYQSPDGVEPADGWQWVTEETWGFGNWATGAPNDLPLQNVAHNGRTFNPGLPGWLTGGDGSGSDGEFGIQFGSEPAIGPVRFLDGVSYDMLDVVDMINTASQEAGGYNAAFLCYDSEPNVYYFRLTARDDGTVGLAFTSSQHVQVGLEEGNWAADVADEDVMQMAGWSGQWEDASDVARGRLYVLEYPVPEPHGVAALIWVVTILAVRRRTVRRSRRVEPGRRYSGEHSR